MVNIIFVKNGNMNNIYINVYKFIIIIEDEGEVYIKLSIMLWFFKKKYKCKSDILIK